MTIEDGDIMRDEAGVVVASDEWGTFAIRPTELYHLATEISDELSTLTSIKLTESGRYAIADLDFLLSKAKEQLETTGGITFKIMKDLIITVKFLIGMLVHLGYPRWAIRVIDYAMPNIPNGCE